ncbi:MAG: carbohydrate-binding domain-containing protein [Ruminococcus sp.]|nr:carbohydrate-binding domain-containing protein [Ruminococcus sp.]
MRTFSKLCAGLFAAVTALSAAGCNSSDESSDTVKVTDTASKTDVLSSAAEAGNVTYDTSVDAADLDAGYDRSFSTAVTFSDSGVNTDGGGVTVDGTTATITAEGTYMISGSCSNGRIVIDAGKKTEVKLVLNGLDLTCTDNAPIYCAGGKKLIITLADGTENKLTDGSSYNTSDSESSVDAVLFSKADLTINGSGSLNVKANYKHGIVSKDSLVITEGNFTVDSASSAITGKDSVKILDGVFNITAGSNGIRSNNSEDASLGFVSITGGRFTVTSGGDAFEAETSLLIDGGEFDVTTGGGSANAAKKQDGFPDKGWNDSGGNITPPDDMSLPEGEKPQRAGDGNFTPPDDMSFPDGEMPQIPDGGNFTPPDDMSFPDGEMPQRPGGRGGFGGGTRGQRENETFESTSGESFIADAAAFAGWDNSDDTSYALSDMTAEASAGTSSDSDSSTSSKGFKGGTAVSISGGSFTIDSSDDCIHSNGSVTVSGGKISAASGDDGIHADGDVIISGNAEIDITKSYEGIEGKTITVSGGTTAVKSSDDGFNASAGSTEENGRSAGFGGISEGVLLKISGGTVKVDASGDGLDSNGDFVMEGGEVFVSGPTNGGNGAIDHGERSTASVSGGTLIACGAVGMEEGFDGSASEQYSFLHNLESSVSGGTEISISDSSGKILLTYTPEKDFQSVVFTSPELKGGNTYTVTAGALSETVTLSEDSKATSNSTGMSMGGRQGGGKTGRQNGFKGFGKTDDSSQGS